MFDSTKYQCDARGTACIDHYPVRHRPSTNPIVAAPKRTAIARNLLHRLLLAMIGASLLPFAAQAQQYTFPGNLSAADIPDALVDGQPGPAREIHFNVGGLQRPVHSVQVQLVMTHAAVGDLDIRMIAANGAELVLASRVGDTRGASVASYANLDGNYLFDDNGVDLWAAAAEAGTGGTVPESVIYRSSTPGFMITGGCPTSMRGVYAGMEPIAAEGIWTIVVRDYRPGNTGGFFNAVLRLSTADDAIMRDDYEDVGRPATADAVHGAAPASCRRAVLDFDGNGISDFAVLRRPDGTMPQYNWVIAYNLGSAYSSVATLPLGQFPDRPVAGDYDGDGRWDIAMWQAGNPGRVIYRPSSNTGAVRSYAFASDSSDGTEISTVGDFNGDGVFDSSAHYRSASNVANGRLIVRDGLTGIERTLTDQLSNQTFVAGGTDYNDDGADDFIVQSGGTLRALSGIDGNQIGTVTLGTGNELLAPGDFGGDNRGDTMLIDNLSSQSGTRWLLNVTGLGAQPPVAFGTNFETFAPADYDGDGHDDMAVWRPGAQPGTSYFYYLRSSDGAQSIVNFGENGDDVPARHRVR